MADEAQQPTQPTAPATTPAAEPPAQNLVPNARTAAALLRGQPVVDQVDEALRNARAAAPTHVPDPPPVVNKPAAQAQPTTPTQPTTPAAEPTKPAANPYARGAKPAAAPKISPEVAALQAQLASQQATIATFVDAEMAQLPANVQAEIRAVAGEDRNLAMRMIAAKKTAGTLQPAGIPSTTTAPAAAAQPASAKPAAESDADAALLRKYEEMRRANLPGMASDFLARNQQAIQRARVKAASRN